MKSRIISRFSIALLVAFCIYPSAAAVAQIFEPGVDFQTGEVPRDAVITDLNGDSHLDLAVSGRGYGDNGAVSVLLGNGDGTFQGAVNIVVGDDPLSISVDDLNGDGIPDLVTGDAGSDQVSVLLGNGNGTYQTPVTYWAGDVTDTITDDLDGDGDIDIAYSTYLSPSVMVLLGNGDGTFQPGPVQPLEIGCHSIVIGDLDQDSIPDLVVTTSHITEEKRVWVLLGNGDATFQPAVDYGVGDDGTHSIAIDDLNGDSIPDLAITNMTRTATVSVLLGNGDGTFQEAVVQEDIGIPKSMAMGDLDGDGTPDLVMPQHDMRYEVNTIAVLLGNGDGTFLPPIFLGTTTPSACAATGDLDGDGSLDLVVGYRYRVSVLMNVREPGVTIFPGISCDPRVGTAPFDTRMSVTLLNRVPDQPRLVAARIQLDLANGLSISNWRAGYRNIVGDGSSTISWYQKIPALDSLTGRNRITLVAEDVTPAPWNQPPYGASGFVAEADCTIYVRDN